MQCWFMSEYISDLLMATPAVVYDFKWFCYLFRNVVDNTLRLLHEEQSHQCMPHVVWFDGCLKRKLAQQGLALSGLSHALLADRFFSTSATRTSGEVRVPTALLAPCWEGTSWGCILGFFIVI